MAELAFQELGNGPTVLLLHGFCENKSIWQPLAPKLAQHARVLALDLPGFGDNPSVQGDASIAGWASQLSSWMDLHQINQAHIIGHSMGGYVALALAELAPQKISGLCLFHSTAWPDHEEKKQKRTKTVSFLKENGVQAFVKNLIPSLFAPEHRQTMRTEIDQVVELATHTPDSTAIAATVAMRDRPDRQHVLENADFPCLFVAGENDDIIPYQDIETQSRLTAQGEFVLLNKCGHMGMYERAEASLDAFLSLIKR